MKIYNLKFYVVSIMLTLFLFLNSGCYEQQKSTQNVGSDSFSESSNPIVKIIRIPIDEIKKQLKRIETFTEEDLHKKIKAEILDYLNKTIPYPLPESLNELDSLDDVKIIAREELIHYINSKLKFPVKERNLNNYISIGGVGAYNFKYLPKEVFKEDELRKGYSYIQTTTKVNLYSKGLKPIDLSSAFSTKFGGNFDSAVEIIETERSLESVKDIASVINWPLSIHYISSMHKGEDVTITGKLNAGMYIGVSDDGIANFLSQALSMGMEAYANYQYDRWTTIKITKLENEKVRISLQKANGQTVAAGFSLKYNLPLYSDLMEIAAPLTDSTSPLKDIYFLRLIHREKNDGISRVMKKIDEITSAKVSLEVSGAAKNTYTEVWAATSIKHFYEPVRMAVEELDFSELRTIPSYLTYDNNLGGGRLTSHVHEFTHDHSFKATLFGLDLFKRGTNHSFYEMLLDIDGQKKHSLIAAYEDYAGSDWTESGYNLKTAAWYDVINNTFDASATYTAKRLFTSTPSRFKAVEAMQKALGIDIVDKQESCGYTFFGLGGCGRSEEVAYFTLNRQGFRNLRYRAPYNHVLDYLRASWVIEAATCEPGSSIFCEPSEPAWADVDNIEHSNQVINYLEDNLDCYKEWWDSREYCNGYEETHYYELTDGRAFYLDLEIYMDAKRYAEHIKEVANSYYSSEDKMESFFSFSSSLWYTRETVLLALAMGAEQDNYTAYMSLIGDKVSLKPAEKPEFKSFTEKDSIISAIGLWIK